MSMLMAIVLSVAVAYLLRYIFVRLISSILLARHGFLPRRASDFCHVFSEIEQLSSGSLLSPIKAFLVLVCTLSIASHVTRLYRVWDNTEFLNMVYLNTYSTMIIFLLITFIGWLPVRLGHVFLDNEKIVVPRIFKKTEYERSGTKICLRKINRELYACLVVCGQRQDVLFIDSKSAHAALLWASSRGAINPAIGAL
jgi:hypothetical protein